MKTILIALSMLMALNSNGNENIHRDVATVTSCNYYAEENCVISCLTDSTGSEWIVYDTEAPVGTKCIVEFDTHGTADIYDDEIVNTIYLSDTAEIVDTDELSHDEIENRNGKLIIEKVMGVVENAETGAGRALDPDGSYIGYGRLDGITDGTTVCTYLVYNPYTSYTDDITARYDFIVKPNNTNQ